MVSRNFLDEKVFFLHVAIVLTCFQSEKSHSFLLKRFTKLVKMNFKMEQSKNSHASVILNSHFTWIFTKALFYIVSILSASKLLRKSLKLPRKHAIMNELSVQIFKPEVDASLNSTCRKVMITYCITKSYHFKFFDWLVLKLQDTETEALKPH